MYSNIQYINLPCSFFDSFLYLFSYKSFIITHPRTDSNPLNSFNTLNFQMFHNSQFCFKSTFFHVKEIPSYIEYNSSLYHNTCNWILSPLYPIRHINFHKDNVEYYRYDIEYWSDIIHKIRFPGGFINIGARSLRNTQLCISSIYLHLCCKSHIFHSFKFFVHISCYLDSS